jgi:hypothetical protein
LRFWDSSAIVPLLCREPASRAVHDLYLQDSGMIVWWATLVECVSAVARAEREARLSPREASGALGELQALATRWSQVDPAHDLHDLACRFLRVHPLRAADACQLAAAFLASERRPRTLAFVTLDDRLADAAEREGFRVVRVPPAPNPGPARP